MAVTRSIIAVLLGYVVFAGSAVLAPCCGFSVLQSWNGGVRDVLCCGRRLGDRLDCSQAAYKARGAPSLRNRHGRHGLATICKCGCDLVPMVGLIVDGAGGDCRFVLALPLG